MNFLIMLVVAAGLYFLSDKALNYIEQSRGKSFEDRSVAFFAIFLGSLFVAFMVLDQMLGMGQ